MDIRLAQTIGEVAYKESEKFFYQALCWVVHNLQVAGALVSAKICKFPSKLNVSKLH